MSVNKKQTKQIINNSIEVVFIYTLMKCNVDEAAAFLTPLSSLTPLSGWSSMLDGSESTSEGSRLK
jgi:hypothetical protein